MLTLDSVLGLYSEENQIPSAAPRPMRCARQEAAGTHVHSRRGQDQSVPQEQHRLCALRVKQGTRWQEKLVDGSVWSNQDASLKFRGAMNTGSVGDVVGEGAQRRGNLA